MAPEGSGAAVGTLVHPSSDAPAPKPCLAPSASPASREALMTSALKGRFRIPPEEASQLLKAHPDTHGFLMSLVQPASALARPPISKFHVG